MSINKTLNYLLAKRADILLCFSAQVTTSSTYLKGSGGEAGDGFPLPRAARIYRIDCWDGTVLVSSSGNITVSQGERLSVYAVASGGNFNVTLRINGINTTLAANGAGMNTTLWVTVHLQFI